MTIVLNYAHSKTIDAFKARALNLSKQDIWLPLLIDPEFAQDHGPVLKIWDACSLILEDLTSTVEKNAGLWIDSSSSRTNVFVRWGYAKDAVAIEVHNKYKDKKLKLANFSGRREKPIDDFYSGSSGMNLLRNGDLPSSRERGDLAFREKTAA